MFKRLILLVACLFPAFVAASEISDFDIGTYALTKSDGSPAGMEMRLSRSKGNWMMEGRETASTESWKSISCASGCEYRLTSIPERDLYLATFPAEMQKQFDMSCIQNIANAFCRLTTKNDPSKGGYVLVALVTGKPNAISLKRLTSPYPAKAAGTSK
jgi:hypothetical protein